ncbi:MULTISPECIES: LacI family DNA-binding transcriptional regulator [Aquimarina]|uniref:LacI family transcriptional regulator n=1 Tax=Aquimarina algiphila TaxID=2047982 RepID=A0A554VQW0_9FLAO|nr:MULTISPECIES: LacI family DNA-binding transcriptional regulator [Aquimarina]TSE11004.1 LacI family transcriptional regulator [Aquimarina algiphila]
MSKRSITLKDLSNSLNLSISTVSRALKDHPDISTETKDKVQRLAKELNYVPNSLAQNLRNSSTKTIGVVIPNLQLDFSSKVINGMIHQSREEGYRLVISESGHSYELEKDILQNMIRSGVDGVLLSLTNFTKNIDHVLEAMDTCPIILYDKVSDKVPCTKIIVDDEIGACKAVEHLIEQGRRKILYINGPDHSFNARKRLRGYEKALKLHDIQVLEERIIKCKNVSIDEGKEIVDQALKNGLDFDAIFAVTDNAAIGAIKSLKNHSISIPQEVAIVGFSNSKNATIIEPNLTSIEQPGYDIGKYAVSYLTQSLRDNLKSDDYIQTTSKTVELKTNLIIRESSNLIS